MSLAAVVKAKAHKYACLVEDQLITEECQPDDSSWAFEQTPKLSSLLRAQRHVDDIPSSEYRNAMRSSSSFYAPSALGAMAAALGVADAAEGMSGTLLLSELPSGEAVVEQRRSIKDHVDLAWSNEALARGVADVKAGRLQDAHKWYAKALDLFDRNVDALVARGCAHANKHSFDAAEADLSRALELDPGNANAAKYLQTVQQFLVQQAQQQAQQAQEQQQEQEEQRDMQQAQQQAQAQVQRHQERQQQQQQQEGAAAVPAAEHLLGPERVALEGQLPAADPQAGAAGRRSRSAGARSMSPGPASPRSSRSSGSSSSSSSRSRSPSRLAGSRSPPGKLPKASAADIKDAIKKLAKYKSSRKSKRGKHRGDKKIKHKKSSKHKSKHKH